MSRYYNRTIAVNDDPSYADHLTRRQIKHIRQYTSPEFKKISANDRRALQRVTRVWKQSDRLWKLAAEYYNDPGLWWVIAWYNQRPTENHFVTGGSVLIPLPIEKVLELFEV
jgi:nucleoid-associated protein YgaU